MLCAVVLLGLSSPTQFPNTLTTTAHYVHPHDGFVHLLALHNWERRKCGLPPLAVCPWLVQGAGHWATTAAANRLAGHCLPCIGYAENCGQGQRGQDEIHDSWMSSPGHRANVVNPTHRYVGFAVCNGIGGPYWVARYR